MGVVILEISSDQLQIHNSVNLQIMMIPSRRPPDNPAIPDIGVDLLSSPPPPPDSIPYQLQKEAGVAQSITWPSSASRSKSKEPGFSVDSAVGC
ncbi:hypothetical protein GCK32_011045 [Trichostrongylus colubriformis]|uniref:Uncharacterized protein n=1 Tax=Trichostrongylus colubriformis TaxID=6319 RepID=A0AAN8ITJ3_TRICO